MGQLGKTGVPFSGPGQSGGGGGGGEYFLAKVLESNFLLLLWSVDNLQKRIKKTLGSQVMGEKGKCQICLIPLPDLVWVGVS